MADRKGDIPTDDPNVQPEDRVYSPSTQQTNHTVQQGGGVGARDLAAQSDAAGAYPDLTALGEDAEDLDDDTELDAGAQQGRTNANRVGQTAAHDQQGPKTLAAQRDQIARR